MPRAKDPARYPLATRLVDLSDGCGSILYGLTNGGRALYKCGRYMRTAGAECESNSVDAEAMLRFTLKTLAHHVDLGGNRDRLRALLEERARRDRVEPAVGPVAREASLVAQLSRLNGELKVVGRRMATEGDDARYEAIAREYDRLRLEVGEAERALDAARSSPAAAHTTTVEEEVDSAMVVLDDVVRITGDDGARADVNRLLGDLGLRIGLTFGDAVKGEKRIVRRLLSGVMAFGDTPLPVPMHGADNIARLGMRPRHDSRRGGRRTPEVDQTPATTCQPAQAVGGPVAIRRNPGAEELSLKGIVSPSGRPPRRWIVGQRGFRSQRRVGARGFEPPTSRTRTVRSSQAELRPVHRTIRILPDGCSLSIEARWDL